MGEIDQAARPVLDALPSVPRPARTVSCVLLTHNLTPETASWFAHASPLFDETVVFLDISRANEETHALARSLSPIVHEVRARGYVEAHLPEMVRACSSDWIFRLDSDEQLCADAADGKWRDHLRDDCTHVITPRRWLHPGGGYINSAPWWPDPQIRLFRNKPERITFPREIHEPMILDGAGRHVPALVIHHHVLRLSDRSQREEKVRHYTRLCPHAPLGHYYLFEEEAYTIGDVPAESAT